VVLQLNIFQSAPRLEDKYVFYQYMAVLLIVARVCQSCVQ
jgi:hypothetical protein